MPTANLPVLVKGTSGDAVRLLQKILITLGSGIQWDAVFGVATEAAVKEFQRSKGLVVDGTVGSKTWMKLADSITGNQDLESLIDQIRQRLAGGQRRDRSLLVRLNAAVAQWGTPVPAHPNNGDENLYPNKIATFSKGLPHSDNGEVKLDAYNAFVHALSTGNPADFEKIPLGGTSKLVNPQAGLAFDLEGTDSHQLSIPPAPTFASAEEAGEIVENYWMALTRDVPFANYETDPRTQAAAADLSTLSDFRGPKRGGKVTPGTLFRGSTFHRDAAGAVVASDLVGPYVSQFLWRAAPFGSQYVEQRMRTVKAGIDYMTMYQDWLSVQRGITPQTTDQFEATRRYIINGRDLGQWVHIDVLYQAYFNACLVLLAKPDPSDPFSSGLGATHNPGNPYNTLQKQNGFGTFGNPSILALLTEVSSRALKAVWYQKWFVHRRLRPEVYAGRIHRTLTDNAGYRFHTDLKKAAVLAPEFEFGIFKYNEKLNQPQGKEGTYLLPMAFPEGSPLHPAYGAGHATVAGACVTILKAFFNDNQPIPPEMLMVPEPTDPTKLVQYRGVDADKFTVGGELNKLASNIAIGRNIAGVHWRTDAIASLKLGEDVAISILKDQRGTFNEPFNGFTFTKFDGERITV
ncbi:MAG: peptidoglycan-binding protein, partial [Kovacikia sp.]